MDTTVRIVPDTFRDLPAVGTDVRFFGECGTVAGHTLIDERGVMAVCLVVKADRGYDIKVIHPDNIEVRPHDDTLNSRNADYWLAVARHERIVAGTGG